MCLCGKQLIKHMRNGKLIILALTLLAGFNACISQTGIPVVQTTLPRIDQMPAIPQPLKIIDWKKKTLQFDSLVFNLNSTASHGPLIWLDSSRRNVDQVTFGLYTVIGDVRQGPKKNNGEFHEALTSMNSLISAGLNGIDKTNQHGFNYVKMVQNYFNTDTKWNIVMNNTNPKVALAGGGYGRDWWYDVYPNVLYYGVAALNPNVEKVVFKGLWGININRAKSAYYVLAEYKLVRGFVFSKIISFNFSFANF